MDTARVVERGPSRHDGDGILVESGAALFRAALLRMARLSVV
jgi:hypothetical protein